MTSEVPPTVLCPRCQGETVDGASFCHRCGLELRNLSEMTSEMINERARARAVELMALLRETIRRSPVAVVPTVIFVLEALEKVLNSNLRTRPLGMALGLALRAARALR